MGNKKRLSSGDGFSDSYTCDLAFRLNNSNGFLPPSPPDSPERLDSTHETSSLLKTRKKRKATLSSYAPASKRVWSKDDELAILKGVVDYHNETGVDYLSDSAAFFVYIKDVLDAKVSKDQLMNKIRKLKMKFRDNFVKKPSFTNSQDSEIFDLSTAIWGKDKAECVDGNMDRAKGTKSKAQTFVEHEVAAKGDSFDKLPSENVNKTLENETGGKEREEVEAVTNGKHDGTPPYVDKHMQNEANGKESEKDGAADELCALQDALETTMFQHLGKYAQKQMLEKLSILRAKERKELSGEWKSLLAQEALLKSKKHSFSAKLAIAALHD